MSSKNDTQIGARFGRLVVVAGSGKRTVCECECGNVVVVQAGNLRGGRTKSCGCWRRQRAAELKQLTHGHTARGLMSSTYESWRAMVARCTRPGNASWKYYGARGIAVCERWRDFAAFLADMGERPLGMTLDRIDPDGNYEPSNCRWATPSEQTHNRQLSVAS